MSRPYSPKVGDWIKYQNRIFEVVCQSGRDKHEDDKRIYWDLTEVINGLLRTYTVCFDDGLEDATQVMTEEDKKLYRLLNE